MKLLSSRNHPGVRSHIAEKFFSAQLNELV